MNRVHIHWHDSLPSTNTYLREWLRDDPHLSAGTVVAAREQTNGRGRYDRQWLSAPNTNLTFSVLVRARTPVAWIPALPMAAALGITEVLRENDIDAFVKWPNDVITPTGKICGILSEYIPLADTEEQVMLLGIGLNVNLTAEQAAQIDRPATSMLLETGNSQELENVLQQILHTMAAWIQRWERGGFAVIRNNWEALCPYLGKETQVHLDADVITGTVSGFGEYGELLFRMPSGDLRTILLGDVAPHSTITYP